MNVERLCFAVAVAVGLFGCSEDASPTPTAASPSADGGIGAGSGAHTTVDVSPECPAVPSSGDAGAPVAIDAGPQLSPTPVETCEGYYNGGGASGSVSGWMHRTPEGCELSDFMLLRPDGTAKWLSTGQEGTWKGDRFFFDVYFVSTDSADPGKVHYTIELAPPSKQ